MKKKRSFKGCCRSGATLTSNKKCAFVLRQVSPDLQKARGVGFTLIELLVVVLIIGILAAVALPQYQKAVEKSRGAQAFSILQSLVSAQEAYQLANGEYATSFDELSVEIPWTGTDKWISASDNFADTRSNMDWSLQIWKNGAGGQRGIYIGRLTGKYQGAGFMYFLEATSFPLKQMLCGERIAAGVVFNASAGAYCEKIFKGSYHSTVGSVRIYTLP